MLIIPRALAPAFAACALLGALVSSSVAQPNTNGYATLDVKGRVQLEVPNTWTIADAEHRKRVTEFAEKLAGTKNTHVAALSVQSYPAPPTVYARVSFVKLEPPITQEDLRNEVRQNRQQVLADLAESWNADAPAMWAALAPKGFKEAGRSSVDVEPLGGQMAMVIRYGRTNTANPGQVMKVAQYHIPL